MKGLDDALPADREEQINALVDGELGAAAQAELEKAADADPAIARALLEARELQVMLGSMPRMAAPRRLSRRLLAIASPSLTERLAGRLTRRAWLGAGGALAVLAFTALVILPLLPDRPGATEIEQGRQDLALALAYLERSRQLAQREVNTQLADAPIDPVTRNAAQAISLEPILREELEL